MAEKSFAFASFELFHEPCYKKSLIRMDLNGSGGRKSSRVLST